MEITDIRLKKVDSTGRLKAYVTVTFDDMLVIHNIKVIEGMGGNFIAMPSQKLKTGEHKDVVHPIKTELRNQLQDEILKKYDEESPVA